MKLLYASSNFLSQNEIQSNCNIPTGEKDLLPQDSDKFDISSNDSNDFPSINEIDCVSREDETNLIATNQTENNLLIDDTSHDMINASSFLNETESWKGKIKKPRGKYLTTCPDIENLHKKPKFSHNTPVLINGNSLPPAKVDNKYIRVRNTCPFDATVQCIIGGYRDWPEYNKYVNESCNPTYELIKNVCATGVTQKIYNTRAAIMNGAIISKDGILDCATNVSSLISMTLLHNVPSLEITEHCDDCGFQRKHSSPVLNVSTIPFYKNGMQKGLQEAVNQCSNNAIHICCRCKNTNIITNCIGGNHMFIDIECLENEQLASRLGYPNWARKFTLSELPTELQFCEKRYILVAAVIYISGERIGHYVAYVRRITSRWELHDDLSTNKKPCLVTDRILLHKRSIHTFAILY